MPNIEAHPRAEARCHGAHFPAIDYPSEADAKGIQGRVFADFLVMPAGTTANRRIFYAVLARVFDSVRAAVLRVQYLGGRQRATGRRASTQAALGSCAAE